MDGGSCLATHQVARRSWILSHHWPALEGSQDHNALRLRPYDELAFQVENGRVASMRAEDKHAISYSHFSDLAG
jgi:hypothetical protein